MNNIKTFEMFGRNEDLKPASIEEVKEIADKVAKAFTMVDGETAEPHNVEEGSFELRIDGEDYAASFTVLENEVLLVSVPSVKKNLFIGNYSDSIEAMAENIKKVNDILGLNESIDESTENDLLDALIMSRKWMINKGIDVDGKIIKKVDKAIDKAKKKKINYETFKKF